MSLHMEFFFLKASLNAFVGFYFRRNRKKYNFSGNLDKVSCSLNLLEETAKEFINQWFAELWLWFMITLNLWSDHNTNHLHLIWFAEKKIVKVCAKGVNFDLKIEYWNQIMTLEFFSITLWRSITRANVIGHWPWR